MLGGVTNVHLAHTLQSPFLFHPPFRGSQHGNGTAGYESHQCKNTHTQRECPVVAPPQARTASPNQLLSGGGRYSIVTPSSLETEGVDSGGRG